MQIKEVDIGGLKTRGNIFLAPLAGYTNAVFRQMCYDLGASLTFTEMVSAKGLCYGNEATRSLLYVTEGYGGIKACQIFGGEPEYIERAVCSKELAPFELIDINMGCPVPKIYRNGEGSALLADLPRAEKIIKACKKSGKRVSVKFRIGLDSSHIVTAQFAKMCEDSGADMITVHGRTRDKIYAGEVNFAEIERAVNAVKIPVIANGGIFSAADADELINKTGAVGVMVARGAMYNPWIFAEITGRPIGDKREFVKKQLQDTLALYGERFALVFMRKMAAFYTRGAADSAKLRQKLLSVQSIAELSDIIQTLPL